MSGSNPGWNRHFLFMHVSYDSISPLKTNMEILCDSQKMLCPIGGRDHNNKKVFFELKYWISITRKRPVDQLTANLETLF